MNKNHLGLMVVALIIGFSCLPLAAADSTTPTLPLPDAYQFRIAGAPYSLFLLSPDAWLDIKVLKQLTVGPRITFVPWAKLYYAAAGVNLTYQLSNEALQEGFRISVHSLYGVYNHNWKGLTGKGKVTKSAVTIDYVFGISRITLAAGAGVQVWKYMGTFEIGNSSQTNTPFLLEQGNRLLVYPTTHVSLGYLF